MASGASSIAVGSFVGAGASKDVQTVGFRPKYVKLLNVTGNCKAEWVQGMADASAQKTVDSGAGTSDISLITSGGVTPLADGFTLGADSDLNVSGEIVQYVCFD